MNWKLKEKIETKKTDLPKLHPVVLQILLERKINTEEKINKNTGDVWDSGLINSSSSVENETGITLKPYTKYYWKVRIRNEKNRLSGYSYMQAFTTGDPEGYNTTANRFVYSINKAQRSAKLPDSGIFYDFGRDAFGTLIVHLAAQKIDTLTVRLGEKITEEGRIDRNPGGTIRYQETRLPVSQFPAKAQVEAGVTDFLLSGWQPDHGSLHGNIPA